MTIFCTRTINTGDFVFAIYCRYRSLSCDLYHAPRTENIDSRLPVLVISYDPLSFATMSSGYAESTMALRHTVLQRRSSSEESGKPTRPSAVDQFFSNVNNVNESSYFTFSTSLLLHLRISERQRYPTVHQSPAACITLV